MRGLRLGFGLGRGGGGNALGPELITNGTFDSGASWTAGGNWSIGSGVASCTAGSFSNLSQTVAGIGPGETYVVEFDLTRSAGSIAEIRMGGFTGVSKVAGPFSTTGRVSVEVVQVQAGTNFMLQTDTLFVGSVDNVSVKKK